MNVKIHLKSPSRYTLDSTPLVGPDAAVLQEDRLHRRPLLLPRAHGGLRRPRGVRDLRNRKGAGLRPAGADLVSERQAVHGTVDRLREPSRQPVPPVGLRRRPLRGLHRGRRVRRSRCRPVRPVTAAGATVCEGGRVVQPHRAGARGRAAAASCFLAWACALPDDTPTEPEPVQSVAPAPTADPNPNPTPAPIMGAPAPKATPTPGPSPEPSPGATPEPSSPTEGAAECGSPTPPALSRLNVKVHLKGETSWVLDSTPLVGPDAAYCAKIGFTDGRSSLRRPPRGQRGALGVRALRHGPRRRHGPPGPTWYRGSNLCTGGASGCGTHAENQYQLVVYTAGPTGPAAATASAARSTSTSRRGLTERGRCVSVPVCGPTG